MKGEIYQQTLLLATRNRGKFNELKSLLADVPLNLISLTDAEVDVLVEETGSTLEENATLKATTYAELSGLPTLADDSGLEVDVLGGEPGPFSARYAGEGATDSERIAFLHQRLQNVSEELWIAQFRCFIAVAWPKELVNLYVGELKGCIVKARRGSFGFGYDPIFFVPELGKTMAELSFNDKNRISHRAIAARKAAMAIKRKLAG